MKPLFIILTVIASVFTSNSYADTPNVTPVVLKSFNNNFSSAKDPSWTTNQGVYQVDFFSNDRYATAYYNASGELIAVTSNISSQDLPMVLQIKLKKNFTDFWVTELIEATNDSGTHYFVTLENADSKIILESTSMGWSTFSKNKK